MNIAALFIFGLKPMLATFGVFGNAQSELMGRPNNLSIRSFATAILSSGLLPKQRIFLWFEANNWVFQFLLLSFFVICFAIILWQAYKSRSRGFNPYVFAACLIGAFIIPPISYDYKLSILPAGIALFTPAILPTKGSDKRILMILLAFAFSVSYSSTLYSYRFKPDLLRNDLPALLVLLSIFTILSCIRSRDLRDAMPDVPEANSKVH